MLVVDPRKLQPGDRYTVDNGETWDVVSYIRTTNVYPIDNRGAGGTGVLVAIINVDGRETIVDTQDDEVIVSG